MSQNQKPKANSCLALREEFDDWAILFDPDTGTALGMNPVSVLIWKHLDGQHTMDDLIGVVKREFSEVPDQVDEHVKEFVDDLVERGYASHEW